MRFELRPGPLRRIVDAAREEPSTPVILVIDGINRANLAKVFGELYFSLECRDRTIKLMYSWRGHRVQPAAEHVGHLPP